jgi:hypothetical protein
VNPLRVNPSPCPFDKLRASGEGEIKKEGLAPLLTPLFVLL